MSPKTGPRKSGRTAPTRIVKGAEAARKTGDKDRIAHEIAQSLARPGKTPPNAPGKLHATYRQEVLKIDESTTNSYRTKLRGMKISDIRRTGRILKAKTGNESAKDRVLNLRDEQARRIRSYSDQIGPKTFRLNYTKVAASHYWKIGIGEVFVNAKMLRVKSAKDGSVTIVKRMVVPSGKHRGRLAFCTAQSPHTYFATFDGDEVTVLDNNYRVNINNATSLASHVKVLDREEATRKRHATEYTKLQAYETGSAIPTSGPLAMGGSMDGHLDKNKSILAQIRFKLSPIQRKHVEIIIRESRAVRTKEFPNGLPSNLIAAMIMNAKMESDLRNVQSSCKNKNGSRERSFGLFQKNYDASKEKGETVEAFAKRFLDPVYNTRYIINKNVLGYTGKQLRAAALAGASVEQLTALFCIHIERPARKHFRGRQRARRAQKFFALRQRKMPNSYSRKFDAGPWKKNGRIQWKNGQETVAFGSSSVSGVLHQTLSKNIGRVGLGAFNAGNFFTYFKKNIFPSVKHFKPPKRVVLAGFALNGVHTKGNANNVIEKSIKRHQRIIEFLKRWGVKEVVIATNQPYGKPGGIKNRRLQEFNRRIRTRGLTDDSVDIAKIVAPNGICKPGTLADGLHLSRRSARIFAGKIERGSRTA